MFLEGQKDVTQVRVTSQDLQIKSENSRVTSQELQLKLVMSRVTSYN